MQKSALLRVLKISEEEKDNLKVKNPKYESILKFSRYATTSVPEFIYHIWQLKDGSFLVPRNFYDNRYFEDFTSKGTPINTLSSIILRNEQKNYFDNFILPKVKDGFTDLVLNMPTGKGKTITSIYLALLYGKNTIVVVPTKQLGNQFIKSIKNLTGCSVGWFNSRKPEIIFDFTISTYQLLSGTAAKDYKNSIGIEFYQKFGHIIFDEAHLAAAPRWFKIMQEATCKYRTSLTATFRRADGMESILKYYTGEILKFPRNKKDQKALVIPVFSCVKIKNEDLFEYSKKSTPKNCLRIKDDVFMIDKEKYSYGTILTRDTVLIDGKIEKLSKTVKIFVKRPISISRLNSKVSKDKKYIIQLCKLIIRSYNNKRNIIVLSSSVRLLFILYKILKKYISVGVIAGKNKNYKEFCAKQGYTQEEMEKFALEKARVILGIDKLAQTGLDVERADTLIFAHPKRDIEQAVGRISRIYENKNSLLVYYFLHDVRMYYRMFFGDNGAKNMFLELGHWVTKPFNFDKLIRLKKFK